MEAQSVDQIPSGDGWQYEPKWDGFRCIAFKDGAEIFLQSKNGLPLARYFPDIVAALTAVKARRFVLDGELIIRVGATLSFEELQLRLHPAASRVAKLAQEHPATYIVFDLLVDDHGRRLTDLALRERRPRLEEFARRWLANENVRLSRASVQRAVVDRWFRSVGGALDGVIAKRSDAPYHSGDRKAAVKVKKLRTADCVVGGFRYASNAKVVGSLLLGLYDEKGQLNHVGFTSAMSVDERKALTKKLRPLIKEPGFTGRAPGGPSRWSNERTEQWEPLQTKLVVEVAFDHVSDERFRHGTRLLRFRPDKSPRQCMMDQIEVKSAASVAKLST